MSESVKCNLSEKFTPPSIFVRHPQNLSYSELTLPRTGDLRTCRLKNLLVIRTCQARLSANKNVASFFQPPVHVELCQERERERERKSCRCVCVRVRLSQLCVHKRERLYLSRRVYVFFSGWPP